MAMALTNAASRGRDAVKELASISARASLSCTVRRQATSADRWLLRDRLQLAVRVVALTDLDEGSAGVPCRQDPE
jgi:hypothetical protein